MRLINLLYSLQNGLKNKHMHSPVTKKFDFFFLCKVSIVACWFLLPMFIVQACHEPSSCGGSLVCSCDGGGGGGASLDMNLRVRNITTGASETTNNITIGATDEISLRWSSWDDPATCVASANNGGDPQFSTGNASDGTDTTVTEPNPGSSRTYTVDCESNQGADATDSLTVTRTALVPVTSIWVRNTTTGGAETAGNLTIGTTDQISIRWSAANTPTSCTASAVSADASFSTGSAVSGTDTTVTEPALNTSRTYTVTCTNSGGTHAASLTVTRSALACTLDSLTVNSGSSASFYSSTSIPYNQTCASFSQTRTCTDGVLSGSASYSNASCSVLPIPAFTGVSISIDPAIVRYGDKVEVLWDGGNAEACSVTGGGLSDTDIAGSVIFPTITGQATYNISCTIGPNTQEASTTLKVLPRYRET